MKKGFVSRQVAHEKSLDVLRACGSSGGFVAAQFCHGNYCNVWGRDSMICSLAALMTEEKDLIGQVKKSLLTLLEYQYKQGQIPSNVNVRKKKASYGQSAGRVDATLWFLIGFAQYVKRTNDRKFLRKHFAKFEKASNLVQLYEFNGRNLIYVPKGGDWADEYVQEGYVLYDQLLYWRALKEHVDMLKMLGRKSDEVEKRVASVGNFIRKNYSVSKGDRFVYHKVLYDKIRGRKEYKRPYLLPFFNPSEYGSYFDGFANSLALSFGFVPSKKVLQEFVNNSFLKKGLLPSFYPVIRKGDKYWDELKDNFSVCFRNSPGNYHNGGLWPMVSGFYVSALAGFDKRNALEFLDGLNWANSLPSGKWGFYEFLNFDKLKVGGLRGQAWSGAAGVMAYESAVNGKELFV